MTEVARRKQAPPERDPHTMATEKNQALSLTDELAEARYAHDLAYWELQETRNTEPHRTARIAGLVRIERACAAYVADLASRVESK